ncbi:MAG: ATP-binding cassette domain-containing protein, partial [Bacteroidia bacterium]|nr:ATP-binding cassette domain-containing protein [Bacteroidia bacterium]
MELVVKSLTKTYGEQRAVDNVSFTLKKGEITGFLGPNGAGKSTTLKIIAGFVRPDSGDVELDGHSVVRNRIEVCRRIGYLPEHNPLYLDMYVEEFLTFCARLFDVRNVKSRVAEIVELVGLTAERHKKIGALSKGYRQRVGLAHALIHDPAALLLDEPTSHLDPIQLQEVRKVIREAGKNKILLFSSHILSEVEAVADRVVIIHRGKQIADTPIGQLTARFGAETVVSVELGRPGFDPTPLESLPEVKKIERISETTWNIHADGDVRTRVGEEAVRQNIPIVQLTRKTYSLEEIF